MSSRRLLRLAFCLATVAITVSWSGESFAQRTSVAREFPIYDNGGKPDLAIDPQRFASQMEIVDRVFEPDDCAIAEGVVGGPGVRRLLRFDTVLMNRGDGDLVVGDRSDSNNPYADYFVFHQCHGHYHIRNFSIYELVTLDGQVTAAGTKQGFCFEDSLKYEDGGKSRGYDCHDQGITSGWGDWYYKQLVGQWIDITDVPEGDYIVRVSINTGEFSPIFDEGRNRYANELAVRVTIPRARNKVDSSK
jgi:lysyl oxidase